ncbi:hypothetical protein D3C79_568510 [compost metagenome]
MGSEHPQGVPQIIGGLDMFAHGLVQGSAQSTAVAAQQTGYLLSGRHAGYVVLASGQGCSAVNTGDAIGLRQQRIQVGQGDG